MIDESAYLKHHKKRYLDDTLVKDNELLEITGVYDVDDSPMKEFKQSMLTVKNRKPPGLN